MLQGLTPTAVQDTIARITTDTRYRRDITDTVLSRAWRWLVETVDTLFSRTLTSPQTRLLVLGGLAVLVLALMARGIVTARARRLASAMAAARRTAAEHLRDADRLADSDRHLEGAHVLFLSAVTALEEQGLVRAHPSMTVGDYLRALRGAGAQPAFRSFSRAWEQVVYGDGACSPAAYAQLRGLVAAVHGPRPVPAAA